MGDFYLLNPIIPILSSERIIRSLKHLASPSAWVIRDGQRQEIEAQRVVPGDVLVLRPGTYVAADAKVLEAMNLSVDESALTGESMPVTKTVDALANENIPLGDRTNMVYMGTLVIGGQGLAAVVATASLTEMGKIQTMVGQAVNQKRQWNANWMSQAVNWFGSPVPCVPWYLPSGYGGGMPS
ncbi:MAG: hypothetical protein IGR76_02695 [Synechococcales cyanobacterium T60_A2020_003]|nr:hypothetical protein [Synechococcales cyanobacterium T60_A2020_003]